MTDFRSLQNSKPYSRPKCSHASGSEPAEQSESSKSVPRLEIDVLKPAQKRDSSISGPSGRISGPSGRKSNVSGPSGRRSGPSGPSGWKSNVSGPSGRRSGPSGRISGPSGRAGRPAAAGGRAAGGFCSIALWLHWGEASGSAPTAPWTRAFPGQPGAPRTRLGPGLGSGKTRIPGYTFVRLPTALAVRLFLSRLSYLTVYLLGAVLIFSFSLGGSRPPDLPE